MLSDSGSYFLLARALILKSSVISASVVNLGSLLSLPGIVQVGNIAEVSLLSIKCFMDRFDTAAFPQIMFLWILMNLPTGVLTVVSIVDLLEVIYDSLTGVNILFGFSLILVSVQIIPVIL